MEMSAHGSQHAVLVCVAGLATLTFDVVQVLRRRQWTPMHLSVSCLPKLLLAQGSLVVLLLQRPILLQALRRGPLYG